MAPSPPVPERLASPDYPQAHDATRTRRFELSGSLQINRRRLDMNRIDEVLEGGSTEVWDVHNGSGTPHNFHPHGVSFRVIDYAGSPPPPHLSCWKDTVYVPPSSDTRTAG